MNILKISDQMIKTSPVFIIGGGRSGSSILYKSLQKHSAFMSKKTNYSETHIFTLANRAYKVENQPTLGKVFRYFMEDQEKLSEFLNSTKAIRNWQRIINISGLTDRIIGRSISLKNFWDAINFNRYFFRAFFFFAQEARVCQRIIEKSPTHVNYINGIFAAFPKAKLLYIYRHPVDTYSSYRRRLKVESELGADPEKLKWLTLSVDDFCNLYKREIDTVLSLSNVDQKRVYLIRYESFTQDPEATFKHICDFLEEKHESGALVEENPDLSKWAPDPNLFGPILAKTKQWENHLLPAEAHEIEENLEETLSILGYASYTR